MMATKFEQTVDYLWNEDTPLLTLAELGESIEEFVIHLECNKDALIRTGRSRISFGRSSWMDGFLTPHYEMKLSKLIKAVPFAEATEYGIADPCGRHSPIDYFAASCFHNDAPCKIFKGIETPECGYREAGNDIGLNAEDELRVENYRPKLFDSKVKVLPVLADAISKRDATKIWTDCLNVLTDTFSGEEAEFCLKMDGVFSWNCLTGGSFP
jgi:hypothetical protein